jgi:hypothetical protein
MMKLKYFLLSCLAIFVQPSLGSNFPYHVDLWTCKKYCNGFLLSDNYVVTTAECVYNTPYVEVFFNTIKKDPSSNSVCGRESRTVIRIHMHGDFNRSEPKPRKHDIAVLQLNATASSKNCKASFAKIPNTIESKNYAIGGICPVSGDKGIDLIIKDLNECKCADCNSIDDYFFCADGLIDRDQLDEIDDGSVVTRMNPQDGSTLAIGIGNYKIGDDYDPDYPGIFLRFDKEPWLQGFNEVYKGYAPGSKYLGDLLIKKPAFCVFQIKQRQKKLAKTVKKQ